MVVANGTMHGVVDGVEVFTCTAGVRVVTSLGGSLVGLVGLSPASVAVRLSAIVAGSLDSAAGPAASTAGGGAYELAQDVGPNEEWRLHVEGGALRATRVRAAPFVLPFY